MAVLVAAFGLSACFAPPAQPPAEPIGAACQVLETLSLESETTTASVTTYEAVVESGTGETEYVSFEAASDAEATEQIAEIEATIGRVTEAGEQVEVGLLDVTPNDDPRYGGAPPGGGQQKAALDQAKFNAAWASHEEGAGIVVGVVDTGVQGDHGDLTGNLLPGADFVSSSGGTCVDPNSHGTHVAGIVGQVDNTIGGIGAAPGVKILPVRVLSQSGSGSSTIVANGIRWAADNGANVINLSLGGAESETITDAVEYAVSHGATVVAAAGNCGNPNHLPGCSGLNAPSFPAALPNVIAVGAVNTGQTTRASFSNSNDYVDITAPGTSIDSTLPFGAYGTKSGTSMATPFVSAVAALILSDCPVSIGISTKIQSSATQAVTGFVEPEKLVDAAAAATGC
ncbi:MAG: S8 family peptidase [Acidimicrobiia bacterium]